jgi:hypothetical protein
MVLVAAAAAVVVVVVVVVVVSETSKSAQVRIFVSQKAKTLIRRFQIITSRTCF